MQWEKSFQHLQEESKKKEKGSHWRHLRQRAFQSFQKGGYPSPKTEEWQYTYSRLEDFKKIPFAYPQRTFLPSENEKVKKEIKKHLFPEAIHLVFVDSHFEKSLSTDLNQMPTGMFFLPMEDFLSSQDSPTSLKSTSSNSESNKTPWPQAYLKNTKHFLTEDSLIETPFSQPFFQLNGAFLQKGVLLYFEKNFLFQPLIQLLFIFTQKKQEFFHLRNGIFLESNTQVHLTQSHLSFEESPLFINSSTQITLNPKSQLKYGFLQEHKNGVFHMDSSRIYVKRESNLQVFSTSAGAQLSRNNMDVLIQGKRAQVGLYGAYLNENSEQLDYYTSIQHNHPESKSTQFYKGLLKDKSHVVFNGKVIIKSGAKQVQSHQMNKNILLSDTAIVHSKPELEIHEDEVTATHGFTSSSLDEQEILYLTSRGISRKEAIYIICQSFLMEAFYRFPCQQIHLLWEKILSEKLKNIYKANHEKLKSPIH